MAVCTLQIKQKFNVMGKDKDIVLVTGFGPFGEHKINASWEAVKLLPKYKLDNVELIVEEVPVLYKYVEENIPLMWKKYNPKVKIFANCHVQC